MPYALKGFTMLEAPISREMLGGRGMHLAALILAYRAYVPDETAPTFRPSNPLTYSDADSLTWTTFPLHSKPDT